MKLEKRKGNVFYSPILEDEMFDHDSQENTDSWMNEFNEMATPDWDAEILAEFNNTSQDEEEIPTAGWFSDRDDGRNRVTHRSESPFIETDIPNAPIEAWINASRDECIILLDDDTSQQCPVREAGWQNDTYVYLLIGVTQKVWALWHAHRKAMQALGFRLRRDNRMAWEMIYNPVEVNA